MSQYRTSYGNGVAYVTALNTDGSVNACLFVATAEWELTDEPIRADVTTCVTPGKSMAKVIGNTSWRISVPADVSVGVEFVGIGAGAQLNDLYFFTTPPSYTVSGSVVNWVSKGLAHRVRGASCASVTTQSNATNDVQRITVNGDSGLVAAYFAVSPVTGLSI